MKTLDFYKLYNLKELDVVEISPNNGNLSITLYMETHSDYMANGFRTEFDFSLVHRFSFVGVKLEGKFLRPKIKEYEWKDSYLLINIDDTTIDIPETEVIVEQNI